MTDDGEKLVITQELADAWVEARMESMQRYIYASAAAWYEYAKKSKLADELRPFGVEHISPKGGK